MRIQVLIFTLLGTILGVTAKGIFSDTAEVKYEDDLPVVTHTLNRQVRSVRVKKPSKKPSKGKKPSKKPTKPNPTNKPHTTLKPTPAPSSTLYPTAPSTPTFVQDPECVIPEEGDGENMPNVNYFMRGYNIMKGNPHQVSVSTVDPGFQEAIFKRCYNDKRKTPDGRYLQPDGTLTTMCQSCSLSAVTKITSGMSAYRESLSEKVKVTGSWSLPWWDHIFSLSSDYQKIQTGIHMHSNYYTHSDAHCCAYQIQTDTYARPPFSQDFLVGVEQLPSTYDEEIYRSFIEAFGTHYVKQADMGSLFGQQTKISKQSWAHLSSLGWSIELASSWSAMFAAGSYNLSDVNEKYHVSLFNDFSSSQLLYTKGSKPPKSNSVEDWVHETKKSPAPISLELGLILDLIDDSTKRGNLKKALDEYCGSNCEEFHNDPWLTNLIIGQRSQPKSCDGGFVTWVQLSRALSWFWPIDGIYDLCFKCSNDPDTMQCFNGDVPPDEEYLGFEMICPENGFERMTTYSPSFYETDPINVKAQCNRDAEPQNAFYNTFLGTWAPWVSCHDTKVTGFQVLRNWEDKIVNFRIKCEEENNLILV